MVGAVVVRRKTTRKLEVFKLQGHLEGSPAPYKEVFDFIEEIPARQRVVKTGDKTISLSKIEVESSSVFMVFHEGEPLSPMFFNLDTGSERFAEVRGHEILATRTHVLLDLKTREVYIEYNHQGAKVGNIQWTLDVLARRNPKWDLLQLKFSRPPGEGFLEELRRFHTIKKVSFKVTRPNPTFTDLKTYLTDTAEESGATAASVEFTAGRGGELEKDTGVVAELETALESEAAPVTTASVTGIREGEHEDATITLARYSEHQRVDVAVDQHGHVEETSIWQRLKAYMSTRRNA